MTFLTDHVRMMGLVIFLLESQPNLYYDLLTTLKQYIFFPATVIIIITLN